MRAVEASHWRLEPGGIKLQSMASEDYLEKVGAHLLDENGIVRIQLGEFRAAFAGIMSGVLRDKFNAAMNEAIMFYTANAKRQGLSLPERRIGEAAFSVVLHHLHIYNSWRSLYSEHKDHPLTLTRADFEHPQSNDQVIRYCRNTFADGYAKYAAGLLDMSTERLKEFEDGRNAFFDR